MFKPGLKHESEGVLNLDFVAGLVGLSANSNF